MAGLAVTPVFAGVAWLWLFGDDPWPQAVSRVRPLIGAGAGLVVFVICLVLGNRVHTRRKSGSEVGLEAGKGRGTLRADGPRTLAGCPIIRPPPGNNGAP